jgi:hypothetical protein
MAGQGMGCNMRGTRNAQNGHSAGLGLLTAILAEFRRAVAAEQRYEHLKRADATALLPADLSRRVFDEFYFH